MTWLISACQAPEVDASPDQALRRPSPTAVRRGGPTALRMPIRQRSLIFRQCNERLPLRTEASQLLPLFRSEGQGRLLARIYLEPDRPAERSLQSAHCDDAELLR